MQQSVDYYINQYLGDDQAAELVGLSLGYIKHNLKHDEFAEIVHSRSVGPMHQLHARLEFDDKARADFQRCGATPSYNIACSTPAAEPCWCWPCWARSTAI